MPRRAPCINDAQWAAVEKTLPKAADRTHVRARLEQIARDKSTPKQRALEQEEIMRACDDLVRVLKANPDEAPSEFVAELIRRSANASEQAVIYRRIRRPRFLRQCELLWLWQSVGGDLSYTTPRKNPGIEDPEFGIARPAAWPAPVGDVIQFFQAAWEPVGGKAIGARQVKDILIDYQHLNFSASVMDGAGTLHAGVKLFTSATRLRTGPYPIFLEEGDQVRLDDGTTIITVKAATAVNDARDGEALMKAGG
jgi:hypothetical protein